jgi:hypothetical protein
MKNYVTYTETFTQTVKKLLPPGRYLKPNDIIRVGDLRLWDDCPPGTITELYIYYGERAGAVVPKATHYRPDPKPKKSKPKYVLLGKGDVIRATDQIRYNTGWESIGATSRQCGLALDGTEIYKRRRRLHVKTS